MVRIAYFGTDGCPGHYAIPIRGKFTEEDIKVIESVDCDDWFIVMAILPTGQVSNHYESKYWDLFDVPERETAFEYDGHTPNEAADRLKKYLKLPRRGMTFEQALQRLKLGRKIKRIDWGKKYICMSDVNILMVDTGQKVASNWNPTEHDIMSNDWEIAG